MSFDRDTVLAALTAEAVAEAYGLTGRWSGRWMRGRRCPAALHGTDAFGLSREGKWHCHACDEGGDLLVLIAVAEKLDLRSDFGAILEIAGGIAGVEPELSWDAPAAAPRKPVKLAQVEKVPPLAERLAIARIRCAWVWDHLRSPDEIERVQMTGRHAYLESRGLPWKELPDHVQANVRDLGFWTVPGEYERLGEICARGEKDPARISRSISKIYSSAYGVAIAVRDVFNNDIVDIRARRAEVPDGEPKILGMPGGVTVHHGELVACYGSPGYLDKDLVIVVEGWADYLTAAWRWPHADVLGAVDAGQYPLVAGHAARYLAERGAGRIVLVAQDDGPQRPDGTLPAAMRAVQTALKRTIGMLGTDRVGLWEAREYAEKDLNDVVRAGRAHELPEEP